MAYKPLSAIVSDRLAQLKGDGPDIETHHIATPRQHDIERILQKEEKPPEPKPSFDRSLLDQVRQKPQEQDHASAIANASRILREARASSPPKPHKVSDSLLKQIRSLRRPGIFYPK